MSGFSPADYFEWASVSVPHPGQTSTGDLHLFMERPHGMLVSVIDGLGHGSQASEAASIAAGTVRSHPTATLSDLIAKCHEALRGSRGIALTLADLDVRQNVMSWAGIGNVEGRLLRAVPDQQHQNESVLLRGGVVGYQIPGMRPTEVKMFPEDLIVFATDGVSPDFGDGVILSDPPERIAERIMTQHNRKIDDALVVVGRYLGEPYLG